MLMKRRSVGLGGLALMLLLTLAAIGLGFALWSKVLTIGGVVHTGDVDAIFVSVFTDDDDFVDNPLKDKQDTGDCPISVGPDSVLGFPVKDLEDGQTSCDPAATGRDEKLHYDKDVARCDATVRPTDLENAEVQITNGYPGYHCTAWFDVVNNGTIPILLHGVLVAGKPVTPCESGASTPIDLNGDGKPDVEVCVSELFVFDALGNRKEEQCDPHPPGANSSTNLDECQFDLDMHVMQDAPQGATLEFQAQVCVHQWNEEPAVPGPFCGPSPEHAPDLVVKFLAVYQTVDVCEFEFEVDNIGDGRAARSITRAVLHSDGSSGNTTNGGMIMDVPTRALDPDHSVMLEVRFPMPCPMHYELHLTADFFDMVFEMNELNNMASFVVNTNGG